MKTPEEVAEEILNEIRQFDDYEYRLEEVEKAIKSDRSRLVQYLREKIQVLRWPEEECVKDCDCHVAQRNRTLESVEKLLEGMK